MQHDADGGVSFLPCRVIPAPRSAPARSGEDDLRALKNLDLKVGAGTSPPLTARSLLDENQRKYLGIWKYSNFWHWAR